MATPAGEGLAQVESSEGTEKSLQGWVELENRADALLRPLSILTPLLSAPSLPMSMSLLPIRPIRGFAMQCWAVLSSSFLGHGQSKIGLLEDKQTDPLDGALEVLPRTCRDFPFSEIQANVGPSVGKQKISCMKNDRLPAMKTMNPFSIFLLNSKQPTGSGVKRRDFSIFFHGVSTS